MKLKKDIWKTIGIGKVSLITSGYAFKSSQFKDTGIPVIKIKDIKPPIATISNSDCIDEIDFDSKKLAKYILKKGDVLIAMTGATIGKVGKYAHDEIALLNQRVAKIEEVKNLSDIEFLFHSISTDKFVKYSLGRGASTAQQNISAEVLGQFEILFPPLDEQKQIASLFQSIETAMEQVNGQEKNLHQLKHKLLKDLFSEKQEFGNHLKARDFQTVKFEKIAINISERVEPKKTELSTYVGLEHLEADNLKIERTGTPDDVIGTKLKIYKGNIIFGKRRAYLRKVAVSHFDGIASAHSMILRANEKNIEKDFLPYFMQSDTFMSRAVQISEGSLSPTIKNKTLAVQEFILPKKEKQKELISVFKQFDTTMEQLKEQKTTLKNLKQKLLGEILG